MFLKCQWLEYIFMCSFHLNIIVVKYPFMPFADFYIVLFILTIGIENFYSVCIKSFCQINTLHVFSVTLWLAFESSYNNIFREIMFLILMYNWIKFIKCLFCGMYYNCLCPGHDFKIFPCKIGIVILYLMFTNDKF